MDRRALLQLLEDVGKEMARLEMREQLERARRTYAALSSKKASVITEDELVSWARMLRVPPHDQHYEIRDRTARCSETRSFERHMETTKAIFPGGFIAWCCCGEEWMVLDGVGLPGWDHKVLLSRHASNDEVRGEDD